MITILDTLGRIFLYLKYNSVPRRNDIRSFFESCTNVLDYNTILRPDERKPGMSSTYYCLEDIKLSPLLSKKKRKHSKNIDQRNDFLLLFVLHFDRLLELIRSQDKYKVPFLEDNNVQRILEGILDIRQVLFLNIDLQCIF